MTCNESLAVPRTWLVWLVGCLIVQDLNEIIYCYGPFLALGCSHNAACHLSNAISIFEFPGTSIKPILVQLNCHGLASDDP